MNRTLSGSAAAQLQRILQQREKKEKTSVSLSGEVVQAADAVAGKAQRSAFVERAVRAYLRSMLRRAREDADMRAINSRAAATNRESDNVYNLQAWPE